MRIIDSCAQCLYDRQANITDNKEYLARIKKLLVERDENDTAPYMVYQFNKVYEEYGLEFLNRVDEYNYIENNKIRSIY